MNMLSNSLEGLAYQLHIDRQFLDGAEAEARSNPDRALRATRRSASPGVDCTSWSPMPVRGATVAPAGKSS
jgi:hypothetical protein